MLTKALSDLLYCTPPLEVRQRLYLFKTQCISQTDVIEHDFQSEVDSKSEVDEAFEKFSSGLQHIHLTALHERNLIK
jgi:hypothetical protein